MTVYAKIINNELIPAKNGYNGVMGMADNPDLCIANGFSAYTEEQISGYYAGTYQIIGGVLTDITNTPEYIAKILNNAKTIKLAEINNKVYDFVGEYDIIGKNYGNKCLYKVADGQHIECTTMNIGKLMNGANALANSTITVYPWVTYENEQILFTDASKLNTICKGMSLTISNVWNTQYYNYIQALNNATTADAVNAIIVNYTNSEDN